jgi:hypothetical protein
MADCLLCEVDVCGNTLLSRLPTYLPRYISTYLPILPCECWGLLRLDRQTIRQTDGFHQVFGFEQLEVLTTVSLSLVMMGRDGLEPLSPFLSDTSPVF